MGQDLVLLLLGSNIEPQIHVKAALEDLDEIFEIRTRSHLYHGPTIGAQGSPDFVNVALIIVSPPPSREAAGSVERDRGSTRKSSRRRQEPAEDPGHRHRLLCQFQRADARAGRRRPQQSSLRRPPSSRYRRPLAVPGKRQENQRHRRGTGATPSSLRQDGKISPGAGIEKLIGRSREDPVRDSRCRSPVRPRSDPDHIRPLARAAEGIPG